jgi:hypothetical protein
VQLLKSATDTCRLSVPLASGVKKNLKFRFGHETLVLCFFSKKIQKPPFYNHQFFARSFRKKCWSFDVSEITGTDGSLILI